MSDILNFESSPGYSLTTPDQANELLALIHSNVPGDTVFDGEYYADLVVLPTPLISSIDEHIITIPHNSPVKPVRYEGSLQYSVNPLGELDRRFSVDYVISRCVEFQDGPTISTCSSYELREGGILLERNPPSLRNPHQVGIRMLRQAEAFATRVGDQALLGFVEPLIQERQRPSDEEDDTAFIESIRMASTEMRNGIYTVSFQEADAVLGLIRNYHINTQ